MRNKDFKYKQDWDEYEGMFRYEGDKTIKLYCKLRDDFSKVGLAKYDMFVAFTHDSFKKGLKSIRPLKEGEKVISIGGGIFGTKDGYKRYSDAIASLNERIKDECDPQEIYIYEFNNHEGAINYEGDLEAIEIVLDIFGADEARKIKRCCAYHSLDQLIKDNNQ